MVYYRKNSRKGINHMEQQKQSREPLGIQVEKDLMEYILGEEVGAKLPNEFELGQMFEVGRSTIREAVKSLATKGVLEVRRGDGTYIQSHMTVTEDPLGLSKLDDKFKLALELLEVRLLLEPEIASSAAIHATEEDKRHLKALCDATEEKYRRGEDHIPDDISFHTCIGQCSKNRVVEMLLPVINTAIMTFANLTHRQLMEETITTHRAVTDAILSGDPVGAKCAMMMHLTYNRQAIVRLCEAHSAETSDD